MSNAVTSHILVHDGGQLTVGDVNLADGTRASESSSAGGHDLEKSACLIPDCGRAGTHYAPGGSFDQTLCCQHFEEFYEHIVDPVRNPVFPRSSR